MSDELKAGDRVKIGNIVFRDHVAPGDVTTIVEVEPDGYWVASLRPGPHVWVGRCVEKIAHEAPPAEDAMRVAVRVAIENLCDHSPMWSGSNGFTDLEIEGREPVGCRMCFPADGNWPCVAAMVRDDLKNALGMD